MREEFLVGVNYWPRRKFVRMWREFDAHEVDADFAGIEGLGLRLVRFFLVWEDFQPAPDRIDGQQLENLLAVFDLAAKHGLLLMPTLLVGLMSGPCWMPAWTMSEQGNNRPAVYVVDGKESPHKPRDMYADPMIIAAQSLLIRTVVGRFCDHSALWGWDLFNEINFVQHPGTDEAERWLAARVGEVHALDRHHPVTAGFVTSDDGTRRGFKRASHRLVDVASEHAYPLYDSRSAGPYDAEYVANAVRDTRAASGKPVLLAEFGLSINPGPGEGEVVSRWGPTTNVVRLADEQRAGEFVRDVLPVARDAGATGALIWCFADYDPSMYGDITFAGWPHERYFGIFDARGRLKATGEALRNFARSLR